MVRTTMSHMTLMAWCCASSVVICSHTELPAVAAALGDFEFEFEFK
jgi:hypothetical protein